MKSKHIFAIFAIILILTPVADFTSANMENDHSKSPSVIWLRKVYEWGSYEDMDIKVYGNYVLFRYLPITKIFRVDNGNLIFNTDDRFIIGIHNDSIYGVYDLNLYSYDMDGSLRWNISLNYGCARALFTPEGIMLWGEYSAVISLISYDGKIIMEKNVSYLVNQTIFLPPIFWNRTIYLFTLCSQHNALHDALYALGMNGTVLWNFTGFMNVTKEIPVEMRVSEHGNVYILTYNLDRDYLRIYSVDRYGHLRFIITKKAYFVTTFLLKILNGSLYFFVAHVKDVNLMDFNCSNGEIVTQLNINNVSAAFEGYEYYAAYGIIDMDRYGNIYIRQENGNLSCYYPNGTLKWNLSLGDPIVKFVIHNDEIFALTAEGFLYALGSPSQSFKLDIYTILITAFILMLLILGVWKKGGIKYEQARE